MAPTLLTIFAGSASAATFTPGDVVVEQIGATGSSTALTSAATAVFLDEFAAAGGSIAQTISLPTAPSSGVNAITASGSATSEGQITNSADGRFIEVPGYNTTVGASTSSVSGTSSAAVPRAVAQVSAAGTVTSTTSTAAFSGNNIRSATSPDGATILSTGALNGIQSEALGSTSSTNQSANENLRVVHVFGGLTFVSTASGTALTSVNVLSSGSLSPLPGLPVANTASVYGFALLRTGGTSAPTYSTTGLDTLYVADSTAGITKYVWSGSTWGNSGNVATAASGLAARLETSNGAAKPVLYFASGTTLYSLADTATTGTLGGAPTALETAGTNTTFRGVAFSPPTAASTAPPVAASALPEAPYALLLPLIGLSAVGVLYLRRTSRRAPSA